MKITGKYISDLNEPMLKLRTRMAYVLENTVLNQTEASKCFPVPALLITEGKKCQAPLSDSRFALTLSTFLFSKDPIQFLGKIKKKTNKSES